VSESLDPYYAAARNESLAREQSMPLGALEQMISESRTQKPQFTETLLLSDGVAVIAEHKRRSPSEGDIRPDSQVAWRVEQYRRGGALALSILTQEKHFNGSLEDLSEARDAQAGRRVALPILRKDFISTPYQLYEAKAFGADAALLILAGLTDGQFRFLHEEATDIGLDCLVEVHSREDLERALQVSPPLIGINNRDLSTMEVDRTITQQLVGEVPAYSTVVAESGYDKPEYIAELQSLGADGVLIGRALMSTEDPAAKLRQLIRS